MGVIVKLAFALDEVPTKVVNDEFEYHFQIAFAPKEPPLCVRVVLETLPKQKLVTDAVTKVSATEGVTVLMVMLLVLSPTLAQPSALT